jgi:hypothetical protein
VGTGDKQRGLIHQQRNEIPTVVFVCGISNLSSDITQHQNGGWIVKPIRSTLTNAAIPEASVRTYGLDCNPKMNINSSKSEICALLGYYAASCGNCLTMFREKLGRTVVDLLNIEFCKYPYTIKITVYWDATPYNSVPKLRKNVPYSSTGFCTSKKSKCTRHLSAHFSYTPTRDNALCHDTCTRKWHKKCTQNFGLDTETSEK